jgi:hypothetical protein
LFKTSEVFWCASPKLPDDNFRGRDFHASYDKTISVYCCRLLVIKVCAALSTCIFIPCSRASGADSPLQARLNHISQPIPTSKILNFSRNSHTQIRCVRPCNVITLFHFPSLQHALSPSHALIMQDFSREDTTANQNKASPANNLPMFPNGWVSFFFFTPC